MKNSNKSLKSQIDLKVEEINNFKKEFEKILTGKDKKIGELQNKIGELQGVFNQTYANTFNTGMNNIKISNKINEEISIMMKKMKVDDGKKGEIEKNKKVENKR